MINDLGSRQVLSVIAFHEAMGFPVRLFDDTSSWDVWEQRKYESMLDEEMSELDRAIDQLLTPGSEATRQVEDALADVAYVSVGAAVQIGLDIVSVLPQIVGPPRISRSGAGTWDLDAAALSHWSTRGVVTDIAPSWALRAYARGKDGELANDIDYLLGELRRLQAAFKSALSAGDRDRLQVIVANLVYDCFVLASRLGIVLGESFDAVHASNMTKKPPAVAGGKAQKDDDYEAPDFGST